MIVALIPVKDLIRAKTRLRGIDSSIRSEIVKAMLRDVIYAYVSSKYIDSTVLITPDTSMRETVKEFDIDVVQDYGYGQVEAYLKAIKDLSGNYKFKAVIFGVADTPFISCHDIDSVAKLYMNGFEVILTPSIDGGTNIMLQRYPLVIDLMHGEGSFQKHLIRAIKKVTRVYVYSTLGTSIDIDTLDDIMIAKHLCSNIFKDRELCRVLWRHYI